MTANCGGVLSLDDLITAKKHQVFEAEVITGLTGGVVGGAPIDYATNTATGQVQKTLPAILRDIGFSPASFDFTTGGTLGVNERDLIVFDPVSMTWYSYHGVLPAVIPPGFDPTSSADWRAKTFPDYSGDLKTRLTIHVNTIADLRGVDSTEVSSVFVRGYYAVNDRGGGFYALDADDLSAADNGGTVIVASDNARWKLVYTETLSVLQFGAKGDGVHDDAPHFRSAINYLVSIGGGKLRVPITTGVYTINSALTALGPVLLSGEVRTDDTSNTNGSGGAVGRPVIKAGAAIPWMYQVKSPVAGNVVWGGGSESIEWVGGNLATRAVWLNNTKFAVFDGKVRDVIYAGVQVDSVNGSPGNFSMKNHIRSLEFVWGAAPAAQNANGLVLGGNGTNVPSTQQLIGDVSGLVYNGSLVLIAETDNAQFQSVHGVVQSGGSGAAIKINFAGAQPSNHNHFTYAVGPVKIDAGIVGTNFINYVSEGGGITQLAGTSLWDGSLIDYVSGRRYNSPAYTLRDKMTIKPGEFAFGAGVTTGKLAGLWDGYIMPNGSTTTASVVIAAPYNWGGGAFSGFEILTSSNDASAGFYRLRVRASVGISQPIVVTPQVDFFATVPAGAQYAPQKNTIAFPFVLNFAAGDNIFLVIERIGADAADTNLDGMFLLGARLLYRSFGPNSSGSGVYDIPPWP